jgi:8-oxo-dGTP pyrophosphatase MutT (NUDIX family)
MTDGHTDPEAVPTHVRVLVLDPAGRLLLMKWRDPGSGRCAWEPPGGGVEAGEALADAAERELLEEAGIAARVGRRWLPVGRDDTWKGERRLRDEAYFTARAASDTVEPQMPTAEERSTLLDWRWTEPGDLADLDTPVHPADPFALLDQFGLSESGIA